MRFRLASTLVAASISAAALVAFAACSNQGEGQPCSPQNGNNDCNDGLVCGPPINPRATNAPNVCCPPPPATGSATACVQSGTSLDGSSSAAPDGSTSPEGGSDSGATDAAQDRGGDAPAESSSTGDASDGGPG